MKTHNLAAPFYILGLPKPQQLHLVRVQRPALESWRRREAYSILLTESFKDYYDCEDWNDEVYWIKTNLFIAANSRIGRRRGALNDKSWKEWTEGVKKDVKDDDWIQSVMVSVSLCWWEELQQNRHERRISPEISCKYLSWCALE